MKGNASIIPFLSTISRQRGYSSVLVGLIFTILPLLSLPIRPIVGAITDKYKCRKSVYIFSIVTMCLAICMVIFLPGTAIKKEMDDIDVLKSPLFWSFFGTIISFHIAYTVKSVLDDTICIALLGENKHLYGEQRVWAAIGWGTMSFVAGVCIDWYSKGQDYKNYSPAFVISLICLFLNIFVMFNIEVKENSDNPNIVGNFKKLFTEIKVQSFFFWSMAFGFFSAMTAYYVFWYLEDLANVYHPETKEWIKSIQGFTLTIQCFGGEVPFFFLSSIILKRLGHIHVFSLMFFTFSTRFFLYSIIENPIWVLPVELLNGITFALAYAATISYAAHLAPVGAEGVFQGIIGMFIQGIGFPIGGFVGGYLFRCFGSLTAFKILSGIATMACISHIIVNQLINRYSKNKIVKDEG